MFKIDLSKFILKGVLIMGKVYGPNIRIPDDNKEVEKYNKINNTKIPNPKTNDIVVNNISCMEFDYTENPLKK